MSHRTTLIPHLTCRNASEGVEFYQKALGAEVLGVFKSPDGRVMNAALQIDGVTFYLMDEMPEHGALSPLALGGASVSLYLRVSDCDTLFARAVAAGCTVKTPLQDMFWGDRYSLVEDPYGHRWEIATTIRKVSDRELKEVLSAMKACSEAKSLPTETQHRVVKVAVSRLSRRVSGFGRVRGRRSLPWITGCWNMKENNVRTCNTEL